MWRSRLPSLVIVVPFLSRVCVAWEAAVPEITGAEAETMGGKERYVIGYVSNRCGSSCKRFESKLNTLAQLLRKDGIWFGKVRVDDKEAKRVAQQQGVLLDGLPSCRLYYRRRSMGGRMVHRTLVSGQMRELPTPQKMAADIRKQLQEWTAADQGKEL